MWKKCDLHLHRFDIVKTTCDEDEKEGITLWKAIKYTIQVTGQFSEKPGAWVYFRLYRKIQSGYGNVIGHECRRKIACKIKSTQEVLWQLEILGYFWPDNENLFVFILKNESKGANPLRGDQILKGGECLRRVFEVQVCWIPHLLESICSTESACAKMFVLLKSQN